jgi:hypothetical protein
MVLVGPWIDLGFDPAVAASDGRRWWAMLMIVVTPDVDFVLE